MSFTVPYKVSYARYVHAEETLVLTNVLVEPPTIEEKIREKAIEYGYSPDRAVAIAKCESNLIPTAKSKTSTASGIFQFVRATWLQTIEDLDYASTTSPFDEDANIEAGLYLLSQPNGENHWAASRNCWAS